MICSALPGLLWGTYWGKRLLPGVAGLLLLYLLLPSVLTAGAHWLILDDPLTYADIVLALAGDPRCLREPQAVELYRRGLAYKIVVSGMPVSWGLHTGDAARQYVLSQDIPAEDILVLRNSWNTRLEAIDLAPLMRGHGWRSAIIVTSPFHSRRALYTLRHSAADLVFFSRPVPAQPPEWRPEHWWTRRGDAGQTVREFLAWGNTLVGGLQ